MEKDPAFSPPFIDQFQDPKDPGKLFPEDQEPPPLGLTQHRHTSEADEDHVLMLRQKAHEAMERRDLEAALSFLSEAVTVGPELSLMYSRRAEVLLKLRRPVAAIRDADVALSLNPNLGRAFRVRGLARRSLQQWPESHDDLAQAQAIDYDEDTEKIHRHVDQIFGKLHHLSLLLKDNRVLHAALDVREGNNPAAYMKYQSDPEIGPPLKAVMDILEEAPNLVAHISSAKGA